MKDLTKTTVLLVAVAAGFCATLRVAAATTEPSLTLSACELSGVSRAARCGALEVPENPDKPDGRRISIGIAVISAAAGRALRDPIVVLMGGPGEDAISAAAVFTDLLAPLLEDRDVLLVDQRGTGRSNALRCELYSADDPAASLRDFLPPAKARICQQQLRTRADLAALPAYSAVDLPWIVHRAHRAIGVRSWRGFSRMRVGSTPDSAWVSSSRSRVTKT